MFRAGLCGTGLLPRFGHSADRPLPTREDNGLKKGSGWFRLKIDPSTGVVTEVKLLQSTGVKILDDSAAVAFLQ